MSSKGKKIIFYALGSLAVLSGLFVLWATRDIPLPNNAKKEGDMIHIDISENATNEAEKKEALFVVPEKFKPGVSESSIDFYFKYPDGTPYSGNDFPLPRDQIRVVIKHHAKIEAARSNYILKDTQAKDGRLKHLPYFVENKDGMEIYKYDYGRAGEINIGTYFRFVAADGNNVLAQDAGEWAHDFQIDRKLSSHIELTYMLQKPLVRNSTHFIEDVTAVDNAVLKLVQSFQSK